MANIRDVVSAAGAKMEDVAKITCFITDIAYYLPTARYEQRHGLKTRRQARPS